MMIFFTVVLPVLVVFMVGYVVQKWRKIDIKSVSTVSIYILIPSLIFRTFYTADLNMQYLYMVVFALILLFLLILIGKIYARIRKYDSNTESALILTTAFMNSGNYGTPIILFAFGEIGFAFSVSFMVLQSIIMNFFGVYYAARGKAGISVALRSVMAMPATYAVILALLFQTFNVHLPENLFNTIDMVANAAIPTVMIILGMQLAMIEWGDFEWGKISYGVIVRLIASPLIAWGVVSLFPLDPILAKVLIVSYAMPSAATIVMYAVEFDAKPRLVSSTTLISTLLSVVTLTILLQWM
ncbi:AEC family transporter [Bacillaceae bacterium S4-13-56]